MGLMAYGSKIQPTNQPTHIYFTLNSIQFWNNGTITVWIWTKQICLRNSNTQMHVHAAYLYTTRLYHLRAGYLTTMFPRSLINIHHDIAISELQTRYQYLLKSIYRQQLGLWGCFFLVLISHFSKEWTIYLTEGMINYINLTIYNRNYIA